MSSIARRRCAGAHVLRLAGPGQGVQRDLVPGDALAGARGGRLAAHAGGSVQTLTRNLALTYPLLQPTTSMMSMVFVYVMTSMINDHAGNMLLRLTL